MKSLLRMSEADLADLEAEQGFRWKSACWVSGGAAVLAFLGMALRYSPGDDVPIRGMDQFSGRLFLAATLGFTMLAAAWAVRDVVMKRLQWAVLLSLLIHLVLCVAMNLLAVDLPGAVLADIRREDRPEQQLALPEYGGMEATHVEPQQWEQPTDVALNETEQQQLERQATEVEFQAEPDPVQHETVVASINTPTRQQQQQEMQRALDVQLQRQIQDAQADSPEQLEDPNVEETPSIEQPELEPQEMERSNFERLMSSRRMDIVETNRAPEVDAARLQSRSDVQPSRIEETQFESRSRESTQADATAAEAETVDIADTPAARQSTMSERAPDSARQADVNLPNRTSDDSAALRSQSAPSIAGAAPSRSTAAQQSPLDATPASGGSAAMQRSRTSSSRNANAANARAESVNVAAASQSSAPGLSASMVSSAAALARGQSSVPSSAAAGGSGLPATRRSTTGSASLQSGRIGRRSGTGSGPQMGSEVGSGLVGGGRGRSQSATGGGGAVGASAQEVSVAETSAGGTGGNVLGSGPSSAASNVGRNSGQLPFGSGGTGTAVSPPSGSRTGTGTGSLAIRSSGRGGLTGRATEPSARLAGVASGTGSSGGRGRRSAGAELPPGALAAEQSGSLVIAGPQAEGSGSGDEPGGSSRNGGSGRSRGSLSGPRTGSVARRSAGLPGSGRGLPSVGRSRPGLPGSAGSSGTASRARTGGGRPTLASANEVASMIRRSIPGISPIPTQRISAGFSMRRPEARREAVRNLGGNDASETAVERGLKWLADHQYAAGNWSIHDLNCTDHDCPGSGTYQADSAATGLAMLAFLGAGYTHQSGEYQQVVERGLTWLTQHQKSDGDLFSGGSDFAWFYSHGMAAIALCEAYGMTKDPRLREPAQRSLNFITRSQHPDFGGWRYEPKFESDTSVSGWQLMALKSGEMADLEISRSTYGGVSRWLDTVESTDSPGQFTYHPSKPKSRAMTAEGLLMRQYLGADRTDAKLIAGADFLNMRLPRDDARDVYYWYYATQVMFHMQGEHWNNWNAALRDRLVDSQSRDGHVRGSWNPDGPFKDQWGKSGGRHYVTCLNLLMLEVYYRHLPLYIELKH